MLIDSWKIEHKRIIENVLSFISRQKIRQFALKGETALMPYYGCSIFLLIESFCDKNNMPDLWGGTLNLVTYV